MRRRQQAHRVRKTRYDSGRTPQGIKPW